MAEVVQISALLNGYIQQFKQLLVALYVHVQCADTVQIAQLQALLGQSHLLHLHQVGQSDLAQAVTEGTLLPEIYLRLLCATVYKDLGDMERAYEHVDKAIEKALPDGLLGVLAEHRRQLGSALDDRLALRDPNALKKLKELHKQLTAGWAKLHNAVLTRRISTALSTREREVAKLVAFGLTNPEIAQRLNLSVASVKSIITMIRNKTGIESRSELAHFI